MDKKENIGTIIHGIAASEHLDSAGEVLDIAGMSIDSLGNEDSVFNWEHNSKDNPVQVCGKVTFAKKIFKKSDCSNKNEEKFWNKCQKPFVYVKGELFDHPSLGHDGAKNVASMLRYDNRKKGKKARRLISFSIEGGKMQKEGMVVKRSIARDVALTVKFCNKMCIAEILDDIKDRDDLYKNELSNAEPLLKSSTYKDTIISGMKKKLPSQKDYKEEVDRLKDSKSFKEKDDASKKIAEAASKPSKLQNSGTKPKRKFTSSNAPSKLKVGDRITPDKPQQQKLEPKRQFFEKDAPSKLKVGDRVNYNKPKRTTGKDIYNNPDTWKAENSMRKAIVAGMMGGSPDAKTGGAALASEELVKKNAKKSLIKNQPTMSFNNLGIENKPNITVKQIDPNKNYTRPNGETITQADIEEKKLANKYLQGQKQKAQASSLDEFDQDSIDYINERKKDVGSSIKDDSMMGVNIYDQESGINEAYDFSGSQSKEEMKQTKGRGNFPSTKHHEAVHQTFSALSEKTSPEHSKSLVNYIIDNFFSKDNIKGVADYVSTRYDNKDPNLKEEHLTHVLDLLTNKDKREEHNEYYLDGKVGNIDYQDLKSGWKKAVQFTKQLDRKQLDAIHNNYSKKKKPGKVQIQRVAPGVSGIKE